MMKHSLPIAALLLGGLATPVLSLAQQDQSADQTRQNADRGSHSMDHSAHASDHGMQNSNTNHDASTDFARPTETGQDAFAAIQEIVGLLESDPDTDWSQVDIDALRDHLIDMHLVTVYAQAAADPIDGGARYKVTGEGETIGAIQRMVTAHAQQVSADTDWVATTSEQPDGVELTVTTDVDAEVARIRGLGFAGFMALGDHHQSHHLMITQQ